MLLVAIGLRTKRRTSLNAKCEDRMAAADSRTILDMPSVYGVPVMHLGVVRMHVGEGQTIDTEVMVMRMQRCSLPDRPPAATPGPVAPSMRMCARQRSLA